MPGDPAALDDRVEGPILTAADLLQLLPFWPDNIETWLIQSESQFRLKGVTAPRTLLRVEGTAWTSLLRDL